MTTFVCSKALEYFLLSAEQNNSHALNHLGTMYHRGQDVEQDDAKALEYKTPFDARSSITGVVALLSP